MRLLFLALASLAAAATACAYSLYTDASGVYVNKWYANPIAMQVKLPTATLTDGSSQSSSVVAAMQAWNNVLGTVQFSAQQLGEGAYKAGNGVNEVVRDSKIQTTGGDENFQNGTLAITMIYFSGNHVMETDIVFNTAYTWDSFRGARPQGVEDIRRVAIHELGHALGLDHPNEAGQNVTAIMNSHVSNAIETLQSDDIAGGQKLYGAPGVTPGNDSFASATTLTLSGGTVQATGSNVAATRQSGEPNHEGVTQGRSVWWKWTPTSSGSVTATTLGSDFDTVLAVYTGAAVSGLTQVASNDDEELPDQNPTPQRKRTSKVSFNATSGTTYHFAVDGWGDDGEAAYTGSIVLNLSQGGGATPPAIVSHPNAQTVAGGANAAFGVSATGGAPLAYQWRRNGVDLVDGGRVFGATTPSLTITNVRAADAGDYAVVVTNSAGSVTSNSAALTVTGVPASTTRLVALSTRCRAGQNDQTLIVGFVIAGGANKDLVVRGVGPTLATLGVSGALADPQLRLFSGGTVIDQNDNWGGSAQMAETFARLGMNPPLPADSKDAALVRSLEGGAYTAHVASTTAATGVALVEVYDANVAAPARFTALSTRTVAGSGDNTLIAGFVLEGNEPKQILIRGVGPTLEAMGVTGVLADPQITVHRLVEGTPVVATNDNWGGTAQLKSAFSAVGLGPLLSDSSKDAALLVTLDPGVYTVSVSGPNNTTGVALVEIYEVP